MLLLILSLCLGLTMLATCAMGLYMSRRSVRRTWRRRPRTYPVLEFYRNKEDARTARGLLAQLKEANENLPDDSDDDDRRTTRQVSA